MKLILACLLTLSCGLRALGQDSLNVTQIWDEGDWQFAYAVAVQNGYAYVATAVESGLHILNVEDAAHPVEVSFYDTPGDDYGVAIRGNFAYVADFDGGLRILDVAIPSSPTEVGFYDTPGNAYDVAVSGNYAYVADWNGGLRIVDVSNPEVPFEVGHYDPCTVFGVAVSGDYAYVAGYSTGLWIVDITNPADPAGVGFPDLPSNALGVAVNGNYAYVAADWIGLRIIDITDPAAPVEVSHCDTPGVARRVTICGNFAYVADGPSGLRIFDVTNPVSPTLAGFYDTPGNAHGVAVSGHYAYVAGLFHFGIYDISAATSASGPFIPHPLSFSLSAYPNPFNAVTTLELDLPREVKVRLAVYDVLGREVTVLKNGIMTAGSHRVAVDAGGWASGNYFVRLDAATASEVQKVTLMK